MKTKILLSGALLVCALALGATWVVAQSGGTITACVDKNGTVRMVAAPTECKDKETALHWYDATSVDGLLQALGGRLAAALNDEAAARRAADAALQAQIGAATKADPPCFDNSNRYVDCGNGTVHDTVTGLLWLKDADCLGQLDWTSANNAALGLKDGDCGLTDNSSPGDWRLPTWEEWRMTVNKAVNFAWGCADKPPTLTNTTGTGCYSDGPQPFTGVQSDWYWASSAHADYPFTGRCVYLDTGIVSKDQKVYSHYAWPVRGSHTEAQQP